LSISSLRVVRVVVALFKVTAQSVAAVVRAGSELAPDCQ
jgi:hypothetical protein